MGLIRAFTDWVRDLADPSPLGFYAISKRKTERSGPILIWTVSIPRGMKPLWSPAPTLASTMCAMEEESAIGKSMRGLINCG